MIKIDREPSRMAIEHYGAGPELLMVTEEVGELLQAISKMSRETELLTQGFKPASMDTKANLITELADTYIVLEHVKEIFNISDSEIQTEIVNKQSRLLWRILSEADSKLSSTFADKNKTN